MSEFDQKAATWDENPERVKRAEVIAKRIASNLDLSKVKAALEYGSGTGLLSFALRDKIPHITLMDESAEMIKVALVKKDKLEAFNIDPIQYNLQKQPLPNIRFDLIYLLLTLHHIEDVGSILKKFNELLTENGHLVIIDLDKEDGSFHDGEFHGHKGFERDNLEALLRASGFQPQSYNVCYKLEKETEEGLKKYPLFLLVSEKV